MKVSELEGVKLDYWVGMAWLSRNFKPGPAATTKYVDMFEGSCVVIFDRGYARSVLDIWLPTSDWRQGGQIIEREEISINNAGISRNDIYYGDWIATYDRGLHKQHGHDPLTAAMRSYVEKNFGKTL